MNTPPEEYLSDNDYDEIDEEVEDEEELDISDKKRKKDKTIKRSLEGNEDDDEDEDDDDIYNEDDEEQDDDDDDDEINIDVEDDINGETELKKPEKKKVDFQQALNTVSDDDFDDDDDNDYDDNYYEKFDNELKENYVMKHHNNLLQHNYHEIETLSKITGRRMDNTINDSLHRTIPILTKYEKARVLGIRAKQIENGSLPLIDVDNDIIDAYLIAQKELSEKKIPFIIKRPLPNGGSEYWKLNDLELICD